MNLQQFRFLQEAVRQGLNLTEAAKALHTSQPGISKAILELEGELGVDIFERHGKRLRRVTEPGEAVLKSVEVILREVANLKRIGEEFSQQDAGTLAIAATHAQARFFLPGHVAQLRRQYPRVQVTLHQAMPSEVARMLLDGSADIGIATESLVGHDGLVTLPCYEWQPVLVLPTGHPLAAVERPSLEQVAGQPLVLYHPGIAGRVRIDETFERAGLKPVVALEGMDADVIKTYVRLGLGAGIVTELAMTREPADADLVARPLGHLFGSNTTRVAFKRGAYLRQFVIQFASLLSERLTPSLLRRAIAGNGSHYDL